MKAPKLLPNNEVHFILKTEDAQAEVTLHQVPEWPIRGVVQDDTVTFFGMNQEIKTVSAVRGVLSKFPVRFGIKFHSVVSGSVDFKTKNQHLTVKCHAFTLFDRGEIGNDTDYDC